MPPVINTNFEPFLDSTNQPKIRRKKKQTYSLLLILAINFILTNSIGDKMQLGW